MTIRNLHRQHERGSALLIVFLFAAMIAIFLYRELPVAAFEAKRAKEELLVERGNEYIRAVQLYVRANKQYAPNMEALENTNRIRFLRRRYKDPFTGKDDWRLLHAGPNGVIIDSKIRSQNLIGTPGNPPTGANGNTNTTNTPGITQSTFGGFNAPPATANGAGANANRAAAAATPASSGISGFFSPVSNGATNASGDPLVPQVRQRAPAVAANGGGALSGAVPSPDGATLSDGTPDPTSQRSATTDYQEPSAQGTQNTVGAAAGQQASLQAAGNQSPFAQSGGQAPSNPFSSSSTQPSSSTQLGSQPSSFGANVNTGVGSNAGFGSSSTSSFGNNNTQGTLQNPGLAGVASKAEGRSIKAINDQTNYALWEFFYDPAKDSARALNAPQGGGATAQANAGGSQGGIGGFNQTSANPSTGGFGTGSGSGIGSSNGFGSGSGNATGGGIGFGSAGSTNTGSTGFSGFNNGTSNVEHPVPISPSQQPGPPQNTGNPNQ